MSATYLIRANTARLSLGNPLDTVAESAQLDPAAARRFITRESEQE
jgi:hypothetical protein